MLAYILPFTSAFTLSTDIYEAVYFDFGCQINLFVSLSQQLNILGQESSDMGE